MSKKYDFFEFSQAKIKWTWQELLFGMEDKIIGREDIINYATHILNEGILGFDLVLKVAIADEYEDILPYIHELINLETFEGNSIIQDKWRYVILKELHNKKSDYDNFNEKVEEIYADFDYPEDMAGFIGYMPSIDGKSMEESWQEYLNKAKENFKSI
ncbi:hypothetical protein UAY_00267 [Enterococcus moraviensis ATCC BAA-383]|uniref:DUF2247 domain-containing protein n=1 Tax=Enterococcus moraviensis ATCC BAA-383 TaxID=1158609 RepID=R2RD36_9ENTE|nr:DUF2247 family protein [Enterococcus moraviensis]EOI06925.1 hypothetical protein UAY_00267 [Enterococcus moraviensis ATCC BAA-383]EOT65267.1 hypothetical protein I586_03001 [Enterococcus moraviensis ATCC BAA-383]OJG66846.1 hypothetical protein RV09_GL003315 [Enterococcus moraviensis]